jgi:hypothetical protein
MRRPLRSAVVLLSGLFSSDTNPFADVFPELDAYGLTDCGGGDSSSTSDPVAAAQSFAGHYQGPWNNTTFGSSGTTANGTVTLEKV